MYIDDIGYIAHVVEGCTRKPDARVSAQFVCRLGRQAFPHEITNSITMFEYTEATTFPHDIKNGTVMFEHIEDAHIPS